MAQARGEVEQHLAARLCGQAARRDDSRVAGRLYRKPVVDGVYPLDEGALREDCFACRRELGVVDWRSDVRSTAIQREMVPVVQAVLRQRVKTLFGVASRHAWPPVLGSDAALRRLVGCNAPPVRQGVCHRGAATRQGPRTAGPICPDTLAANIVPLNLRALEALCQGVIRALAQRGGCAAQVTGIVDATALEPTAQDEGGGQVTRKRQVADTRRQVHERAVTVDGCQRLSLIEARTKIPLAGKVVPMHAPEVLSRRALVTQARRQLAGDARLPQVVFAKGCLEGVARWWLAQPGLLVGVPAKDHMAVPGDAQAQAAAGEGVTIGRRAHTVRHGQGKTAWTERLETEVVGLAGLTTDDPQGTPAHGRHHHRRACQANRINAVVVRQGNGHAYGPAGQTVFVTPAPVAKPLQPFDDEDDRRPIEHCSSQASKPPWRVQHPPQKSARAVRVHGLLTLLTFAWATA